MDFATLKYRDVFTCVNTGLAPNLYTSTTASGNAVKMGAGVRKLVFETQVTSSTAAVGQVQLLLYACSASTGTGMTLLGTQSLYPVILGSVASATVGGQNAIIEVRGEYLETNSVGPWVVPLLSVSGAASHYLAVTTKAFLRSYQPSSNYDTGSYVNGEYLLF